MARRRLSKSSLYWFINNRSFVYIADVRRRFGLESRDDVCIIRTNSGAVFLGLDNEHAHLFQALYNEQKIGFELATDIRARSVVGIFTKNSQRGRKSRRGEERERSPIRSSPAKFEEEIGTKTEADQMVAAPPQAASGAQGLGNP